MLNRISCVFAALTTLAVASSAQASGTDANSVFLTNMPYTASGEYIPTGDTYQMAPVYVHESGSFHLYRRANGNWHVDFNAISEDWSGTIAYTTGGANAPWLATWQGQHQSASRTSAIYMGGLPYAANGEWHASGEGYEGAPIFDNAANSNFRVYRRQNGRWHADFNEVSEDWNGTFAYTTTSAAAVWDAQWQGNNQFAMRMDTIEMSGLPYSAQSDGEYVYTGETFAGAPVFTHVTSGWKLYRRSNGFWYVDFNEVSEDYDGSISYSDHGNAELPHLVGWKGAATALPDGTVAISTVSLKSSKSNLYVVAEQAGGGDVNANRSAIGAWETLTMIELKSGFVLIQAPNGQFICPDNGGGSDVHAYDFLPTENCELTAFELNNGKTAFMTKTGNYLRGKANGELTADRTNIKDAESFIVIEH